MSYPTLGATIPYKAPVNPYAVPPTRKTFKPSVTTVTPVPVVEKKPKTPTFVPPTVSPNTPVVAVVPSCSQSQRWDAIQNACVSLTPTVSDTTRPTGMTPPTLFTPQEPAEDAGALDNATSPLPLILAAAAIGAFFLFGKKGRR